MATAETREQLIRATREAIRDVGMAGSTAREIAGRASANLASIPYHFGSKDALVAEALVAEARDLVAPVLALLASEKPPPERAMEAAGMLNELFVQSRTQVPVYLAALAAAPHSPDVREGLGALWRELRERLADDVRRQLDEGHLPPWVQPDAMASLILSLVNGVVLASVVDPDGPDHQQVGLQFVALLLAAGSMPGVETPASTGTSSESATPPKATASSKHRPRRKAE